MTGSEEAPKCNARIQYYKAGVEPLYVYTGDSLNMQEWTLLHLHCPWSSVQCHDYSTIAYVFRRSMVRFKLFLSIASASLTPYVSKSTFLTNGHGVQNNDRIIHTTI